MDNQQDDRYAARRAELAAQFQSLPPAGSDGYWRHIEEPDTANRLPLEVLARCFRERHFAGIRGDAERIFKVIMERIRGRVGWWAKSIARQARSGSGSLEAEDLEQECHLKLWEELVSDDSTFLLESFMQGLHHICQHVGHGEMERAGEWRRPGVETPKRIPRGQLESLQAEPEGVGELPLSERTPDEKAQDEIEKATLSDLFDLVRQLPHDERIIIHDWLSGDRTQEDTAATLGVTARTIRNRLTKILDELRRNYRGGEGDGDD